MRPLLESEGHHTVAVDLPLGRAGFAANVSVARDAIGDRSEVVVVGHALGCALIPAVSSAVDAVAMVWVCGIIPVPGVSCADQMVADPDMVPMFEGRPYEGTLAREPELLAELLFPDADAATKTWAIDRIRAAPEESEVVPGDTVVTEPYPEGPWPEVSKAYVLGRDDRALAPDWCRAAARERLGVTAMELDGGHTPLLSRPGELAEILRSIARTRD